MASTYLHEGIFTSMYVHLQTCINWQKCNLNPANVGPIFKATILAAMAKVQDLAGTNFSDFKLSVYKTFCVCTEQILVSLHLSLNSLKLVPAKISSLIKAYLQC